MSKVFKNKSEINLSNLIFMKNSPKHLWFIFGLVFFCFFQNISKMQAQNFDYDKAWKEVDSLYNNEGLPKSALEKIDKIYQSAVQEENTEQTVKTVFYQLRMQSYIQEESLVKAIGDLRKEVEKAEYPLKPILHSVLAEVYWRYYQNNRYRFLERTALAEPNPDDVNTWDLNMLIKEVKRNYLLSLKNPNLLQQTSISDFKDILTGGDKLYRSYRPTLYDFLAHRAIDFFINSESELTKPSYAFQINQEDYFADANTFVNLNITTQDTASHHFQAMLLFQDLTKFHLKESDPSALVDLELKRLNFVNNNSILSNKEQLYTEALIDLESKYLDYSISTKVTYYRAKDLVNQGTQYNASLGEEHLWDYKDAYELCKVASNMYPDSEGAKNCLYLMNQLTQKYLYAQSELVNIPEKPFRVYLEYQNISEVYFRAVPIKRNDLRDKYRKLNYDEFLDYLLELKPEEEWSITLVDEGDFRKHSVEVKAPELPAGEYVILMSNRGDFVQSDNRIAYAFTAMSHISYVSRQSYEDGTIDLTLLNRETGEPLANADVKLWVEEYNYKIEEYETKQTRSFTSDKEGYVQLPYMKNKSFFIEFNHNGETFYTNDGVNYGGFFESYKYNYKTPKEQYTTFFLDRAIYRPGQTIYFKGILLESDGENHQILANRKTTVSLFDANYQKVTELELTTNEYGTFNGEFIAPSSGMMGEMHIENNSGSVYFSVEEYKRPKFEVKFKPIEGEYRLEEKVSITGNAKAYSGANIDGAEVSYRVIRETILPWWWLSWYGVSLNSSSMVLTQGTTETDENGEFTIDFEAIPDYSVSKKFQPYFAYQIYADVTDINGETRSGQSAVNVGYQALQIQLSINDILDKQAEENKTTVLTKNLSGESQDAKVNLKFYKLKSPERLLRKRTWGIPDKFLYTESEWISAFPNDPYKNEDNFINWEKEKVVFETSINTAESTELDLSNVKNWETGMYFVEASTQDSYGEEVKSQYYFSVYDSKSKKVSLKQYALFWGKKILGEPKEEAQILLGSGAEDTKVLMEVEHKGKIIQKKWLSLDEAQTLEKFDIVEEYRGNFGVHFLWVKDNRVYKFDQNIYVPYTNKQLDITFETFRDKLQPGEKEEWKLKVKGKNGDKVAAEMLITLYDASLDEFRANNWNFSIYNSYYLEKSWGEGTGFSNASFTNRDFSWNKSKSYRYEAYDQLNWFGYSGYFDNYALYYYYENDEVALEGAERTEMMLVQKEEATLDVVSGEWDKTAAPKMKKEARNKESEKPTNQADMQQVINGKASGIAVTGGLTEVKARSNFAETAFFYPELKTNEKGEVIVSFTIPESLTRWKMMGFAHTKDLSYGFADNTLITQKELMVVPNAPRFFRENDQMNFTSKITNISENNLSGQAQLFLFDAQTDEPIDFEMGNDNAIQSFETKAGQSTALSWNISIPVGYQAIKYKVVAQAGNFSDGEEMVLPVLTNSMLVTETLPLPIRGGETKTFELTKLSTNSSTTLRSERLTLEFTANPAWYAIQALPYLMEFPHECAEQTFSRVYANSIAAHIANSSPKIQEVFNTWRDFQPDALVSNLEKNEELKSLLLEETPWVMQAQNETERKQRVAVLFDLNRMAKELDKAITKLEKKQLPNGAWSWFDGMEPDRYITQHIVTGFGHLLHLGVDFGKEENRINKMTKSGLTYLDRRIIEDYKRLLELAEKGDVELKEQNIGYSQIQYLYARSFFDAKIDKDLQPAYDYFEGQAQKYWLSFNKYMQGMIALALHRNEDAKTPQKIVASLREHALYSEEMGMYWKQDDGYYWYQAPIETQAILVEVFSEVAQDQKAVDDLKTWLLKQKQTQDWKTTKATAEACYVLILTGTDWLEGGREVDITIGGQKISPYSESDAIPVEAGTGYFKTAWTGEEITNEMGNITIEKRDEGVAWGAVYWQYFEQLDKITSAETPLVLKKEVFIEQSTDQGQVLKKINENTPVQVGDLLKVRIVLQVDRAMEYVHMKDMRAAGLEPTNVISRYKYQDGLGYYESTRDAATHFFFGYLPKGTFVFEYPLRVTHSGDFSNGITTIQCMYAPEFSSHSEGIRLNIVE